MFFPGHYPHRARSWGSGIRFALTEDRSRDAAALDALRRFVEEFGQMPTQDSWTAAGMSPSERTVRKRFCSFRAAIDAAGVELG